jgi:hypothetical protein
LVASVSGSVTWRDLFLSVLLALVDLYFIASFAAAFFVARRHGWQLLLILPVVFAAYQLPYALGFLSALFHRQANRSLPNPLRKTLTTTTR